MSVVTIPFDFETSRDRRGLVPICISETDADGHRISRPWFEAVIPMADYRRKRARERMHDVWRVSELAELSVHAQWRNHREDFGRYPHRRIAAYARWTAEDLRCGDTRLAKVSTYCLAMGTSRSSIRSTTRPGSTVHTT